MVPLAGPALSCTEAIALKLPKRRIPSPTDLFWRWSYKHAGAEGRSILPRKLTIPTEIFTMAPHSQMDPNTGNLLQTELRQAQKQADPLLPFFGRSWCHFSPSFHWDLFPALFSELINDMKRPQQWDDNICWWYEVIHSSKDSKWVGKTEKDWIQITEQTRKYISVIQEWNSWSISVKQGNWGWGKWSYLHVQVNRLWPES